MLIAACLEESRGLMLRQGKEKWSREIKRSTVRLPHQLMAESILTSLEPNSHFLFCNVGSSLIAVIFVLSAIAVLASDVSRSAEKQ